MADKYSQTMSLPGFKAEPIVDRSGAMESTIGSTVAQFGNLAIEGYKAYEQDKAVTGIESDIKSNIDNYLKQSPTYIAQTNLDVQNLQSKLNDPTVKEADIPGIVKSLNEKTNFLQTARDQRKISDYEFTQRVNQLTRESVSKNPAFTKEIISKAQQVLDLNNIQQTIKMDSSLYESARKSQEEERKNLRELGEKFFIMPPKVYDSNGVATIDYTAFEQEVRTAMDGARIAKATEMLATTNKNVSEVQVQSLVKNNVHMVTVRNTYTETLSDFKKVVDDPNLSLDKKILTFDLLANQKKQKFAETFGQYYSTPEIKGAADFLNKQIDGLVTSMKNSSSGKDQLEILETNSKLFNELSKLELINMGIDPAYTKTLSDLAPYLNKFNLNPKLEQDLINYGNLAVTGIIKKMETNSANAKEMGSVDNVFQKGSINLKNGQKLSINGGYLNSSSNSLSKGDATVIPVFKQSLDNYISYINFDSDYLGTKDRAVQQKKQFGAMEEMFQQIGDPKFKDAAKYIDQYQSAQLLKGVDEYNRVIHNNFIKYRTDHPNEKVRISQNWDGTLIATGGSEEFNTNYVGRINTALKAYSTLQGKNPNEVSNEFYSRYYQDIFTKNVSELSMKVKPVEEGNIDLKNRPVVKNPDGTISTVRSMSFRMGNTEILIPTVADSGKIMTENEAIKQYLDTGRHLGKFRTAEEATTFAKQLHNEQAQLYAPGNTLGNFASTPGGGANKKEINQGFSTVADKLSSTTFNRLNDQQKADLLRKQEENEGTLVPGSVAARHNNPGAMVYAPWQKAFGAVKGETIKGEDGKTRTFARFPNLQQGRLAQRELWAKKFGNSPLNHAIKQWVSPSSSNDPSFLNYQEQIASAIGI